MINRIYTKKERFFCSRIISVISVLMFISITAVMIISNNYLSKCVNKETQANQNRLELSALGQSLADASDYLTDEARKYSVTGNIEHLYNYWYEVNENKTRDKVINELESYNPPENEKSLMTKAKSYSDNLIATETVSMKLMLLSQGKVPEDYSENSELYSYVEYVENAELPTEYQSLSKEEMKSKSREILYNSFYDDSKTQIMSPIQEYQNTLSGRLDDEVALAAKGCKFASNIQSICSAVSLFLIAMLFICLNNLYIKPLNEYAKELSLAQADNDFSNSDFSEIRVTPKGAYELYNFGKTFNKLSLILNKELKKRTKAEQEMRIAKDEADKANNVKSEFLAQMSHELRTPLNAITGYLYLLENTALDRKQQKYCRNIKISSESLLGLINNVLDFSKIESGKLQLEHMDFNLIELLKDVCSIMENGANQKNIALRLDISGDIPMFVKGDSLRLQQVLINLIGNAIKFTPCGEVVLSVECLENQGDNALIKFAVKDSGIGIDACDTEKIFEPFIQSNAGITGKYGGTGLGLPISQMIVKAASSGKYKIEVESEKGKGSCFNFNMEFEYGVMACDEATVNTNTILSEDVKILLVDDNKVNLDIEREILKTYGADVITADSGKEAISLVENNTFDLIFLDLHMPDIDGYQTAQRMRKIKNCSFVPIIALTADVVSGVEEKVHKAGMNDYISKPFNPQRLFELIKEYLDIAVNAPEKLYTGVSSAFDYAQCISNLGINKAVVVNSINIFLDSNKFTSDYIKEHISDGNYSIARRILHDVIGVSGNLCCKRLYDAALQLSNELKNKTHDSECEFYAAWDEAVEEMRIFAEINAVKKSDGENIPFSDKWKKFILLCSDFDIAAVDYFDNNIGSFKKAFGKNDFKKLDEYVRRYAFSDILEQFSYFETEE